MLSKILKISARRKTFLPSSIILQITSAMETYQTKTKTYGVGKAKNLKEDRIVY